MGAADENPLAPIVARGERLPPKGGREEIGWRTERALGFRARYARLVPPSAARGASAPPPRLSCVSAFFVLPPLRPPGAPLPCASGLSGANLSKRFYCCLRLSGYALQPWQQAARLQRPPLAQSAGGCPCCGSFACGVPSGSRPRVRRALSRRRVAILPPRSYSRSGRAVAP
jgi:hypothetical protein